MNVNEKVQALLERAETAQQQHELEALQDINPDFRDWSQASPSGYIQGSLDQIIESYARSTQIDLDIVSIAASLKRAARQHLGYTDDTRPRAVALTALALCEDGQVGRVAWIDHLHKAFANPVNDSELIELIDDDDFDPMVAHLVAVYSKIRSSKHWTRPQYVIA